MRIKDFDKPPPNAPPAWDPPAKNSRNRALGPSPTYGALGSARESRVQLTDGLNRTKETPTSSPAGAGPSYHWPRPRFMPCGSATPVAN
jgi:hypothetical protein